ncbi:MAG: BatD family protein [Spirochaetota bacterium]
MKAAHPAPRSRETAWRTAALPAALFLLCVLAAGEAPARGGGRPGVSPRVPSATVSVVSPQPFTIGDPIDVSLTVYHHRGEQVSFAEDPAHFTPFTLREITVRTRRAGRGTAKTMVLYTLTSFQTGNITLSPLPVTAGGVSMQTDPLVVPILSVLPRDDPRPSLKDIVGPYRARVRPLTIAVILGGLAAAFGCYLLLSRLLRRRVRKTAPAQVRERPPDPYRFTLSRLNDLKQRLQRGDADAPAVYQQLSHLLRLYFGYLWELPALEMTTAQIRRALRARKLGAVPAGEHPGEGMPRAAPLPLKDGEPLDGELLLEVLGRSDLVKFARERPEHPLPARDVQRGIELVRTAHRDRAYRQHEHAEREVGHGV